MSEFLCPKTGERCDFAQAMGVVIGTELQKTFRTAVVKVAELGYLASLEMKIDNQSISDIRRFERFAGQAGKEDSVGILKTALVDTTQEMLPVFIACGADSGTECAKSDDAAAQKEAISSSLLALTTKIGESI